MAQGHCIENGILWLFFFIYLFIYFKKKKKKKKKKKGGGGGAKPTQKSLRLVSLCFCRGFIDVALKSIVGNPCTVNLFYFSPR